MAKLFATKNDLARKTRAALVALLDARLLDAIDLQLQAKQAHWNVKGPQFIALHELFDKVAGGSKLAPYPLTPIDGAAHVEALSSALARFGAQARKAIDQADARGDKDTADIFTEISRQADKYLWFVEAHQQG